MQRHLLLVGAIAALVGCGGAEPEAVVEGTTTAQRVAAPPARHVDLDAYPYTTTIPLRHGAVVLGTNSLSDPEVAFALRAEAGEIALNNCDYLEVRADDDDLELGFAEYRQVRGSSDEELVTVASREVLERLGSAERSTLVTCHELLELDAEFRARLRAFLSGSDAPERATVTSRTITLEGGSLSVAYRSDDAENIRFQLSLADQTLRSCPRMAFRVGARTVEMHPPQGEHDPGVFFITRSTLRSVVSQSSARFIACGHTYELQAAELGVIADLIGGS